MLVSKTGIPGAQKGVNTEGNERQTQPTHKPLTPGLKCETLSSTTTKFVNRACAVHGISLPVVVDKVVVVVLKFPIIEHVVYE